MNAVEYAMKMKDMMSGPLGNIAKSFDHVSDRAKKAGESTSLFSKIASGAFGLNNIMGAAKGALDIASSLGSKIGETMQASLDRQQLQVSFDVLTGSHDAGSALTNSLVELQKNTILGSEVFKDAQTMLSFGFKDTEVVDNLRMLGDVSMGDAAKLDSLTLAFSQIRSAGKLQGQDLLQLINAGFNPLETMAERTGKSIGELKDEMSKGNITFEMVQQAFKDATGEGGKFNNMLGTIAKTDAGMKAQLGGALNEVKIKIGDAFQPLTHLGLEMGTKLLPIVEKMTVPLSEGVQAAVDGIQRMITHARSMKGIFSDMATPLMEMFSRIGESMAGFADYLEPVRALIEDHLLPYAQTVIEFFSEAVGDLAEFIANSELLKDLFSFIGSICSRISDIMTDLVNAMRWLWNNVVMPILNGIETAYRLIKGSSAPKGSNKAITSAPEPTTTPQQTETQKTLEKIATNTGKNNASAKSASSAVASSGPKVVNINVQKFFDNLTFSTTSLQESRAKIEEVILETLSRVLVQGAASV